MTEKNVKVQCFRFNPETDKRPHYQTYLVPLEPSMTLLDALEYIYENLDSSLAFYANCRRGLCQRCLVSINGKNNYACRFIMKGNVKVRPPPNFEVVRDLFSYYNEQKLRSRKQKTS